MKEQILQLRKEGKSYKEIGQILGCSKGSISYHCGVNQKEKTTKRTALRKLKIKSGITTKRVLLDSREKERTYQNLFGHLKGLERHRQVTDYKILHENFYDLKYERLKRRIEIEQDFKCNNCKLDRWLNKEIPLELEHIDGDNTNNIRTNLECLCPNCHALTSTWKGRNKKNKRLKVKIEDYYNSYVKNNGNTRQALLELGLTAKGGNYKRMYEILEKYYDIKVIKT